MIHDHFGWKCKRLFKDKFHRQTFSSSLRRKKIKHWHFCRNITATLLVMDVWRCVLRWPAPFPVFTGASVRKQFPVGVLPSLVSALSWPLASFGLYSLMNASDAESVVHANEIIRCDWGLGVAVGESNLQFPRGDWGVFPKILIIHSWWKMPQNHRQMVN